MGEYIVYVCVDDWAALYVNGERVFEGHSVPQFAWIEAINKTDGFVRASQLRLDEGPAQEWVEDYGGFPLFLGAIPEEIRLEEIYD